MLIQYRNVECLLCLRHSANSHLSYKKLENGLQEGTNWKIQKESQLLCKGHVFEISNQVIQKGKLCGAGMSKCAISRLHRLPTLKISYSCSDVTKEDHDINPCLTRQQKQDSKQGLHGQDQSHQSNQTRVRAQVWPLLAFQQKIKAKLA